MSQSISQGLEIGHAVGACKCGSEPAGSNKMRGISWLAEDLWGSQEELCSMVLFGLYHYKNEDTGENWKMHSVVSMLNKHIKFDTPLGQNNRLNNTDEMSTIWTKKTPSRGKNLEKCN